MRRLVIAALAVGAAALLVRAIVQTPQPRAGSETTVAPVAAEEKGAVPIPEPTDKALRYYRSGNALWALETAWMLAVPFAFSFGGFGGRLRRVIERVTRANWLATVTLFGIAYTAIVAIVDLPLSWYAGFVRQHEYGLSNQSLEKWAGDWGKGLAVSCVMAALVTWIPYLLLKKSPRRWWFYSGLAAFPLTALLLIAAPVWIDPLFNKFGPMKDRALEAKILGLADRAGIDGGRVFEADKSEDTNTVNAYVAGFMATKRIVLWDTIIRKLREDELLFVMAHEMGHYVLGHVAQSVLIGPLCLMFGLFVTDRIARRLISTHGSRLGVEDLSDSASLPLIVFIFTLGSLAASPALLAYSRHLEHEADRFALEVTRANAAGARAFVVLQEENLSNPRPPWPWVMLRASHPPLGERIDFCNSYRPWESGEPLRYGGQFR